VKIIASDYIGMNLVHKRGKVKVKEMKRYNSSKLPYYIIEVKNHRHDRYKKGEIFTLSESTLRRIYLKKVNNET